MADQHAEEPRGGSDAQDFAADPGGVLEQVIAALRDAGVPLSIDTRKAAVAAAALAAGAGMVNDVSALTFDPGLAAVVATAGVPASFRILVRDEYGNARARASHEFVARLWSAACEDTDTPASELTPKV
jgi:hypothetical protein